MKVNLGDRAYKTFFDCGGTVCQITQNSMQLDKNRPKLVSTAIIFLGVGWGIYILMVLVGGFMVIIKSILHDWYYPLYTTRLFLTITITLDILIVFIYVFMLNSLANGKNWVRFTFIVLFILLIPSYFRNILWLFNRPIVAIADICQVVIISLALLFLFQKESNEWFKTRKANYLKEIRELPYNNKREQKIKYTIIFIIILLVSLITSFIISYLMTSPFLMTKNDLNKVLLREAFEGRITNVEKLFKYGADMNTKNEFGSTPFNLAIAGNNIPVVELLLKLGQDPNDASSKVSPLQSAAANGELELTKLLLKNGADPDYPTEGKNTALMSATGHTDIFKILINHGANINAKDDYNRTVLIWAACHGTREVVEILCSLGADINAKDEGGNTALSLAKKYNKNVVDILERCNVK